MIRFIPASERPRERCLSNGARCLSLRECVAVLLGSGPGGEGALGLSSRVLERAGAQEVEAAFFSSMENGGLSHLQDLPGLGDAGRARLLAAFEIGRRYVVHRQARRQRRSPSSIALKDLHVRALSRIGDAPRNEPQEWLGFVPIHPSGSAGGLCIVERGVRTHVNFEPAELFARVLSVRPHGFFLFHNHPSGDLTPSDADHELTRRVRDLSSRLGVRFLGHGIVGPSGARWVGPSPA
jgi:DNA repair protein RadC